MLAAYTEGMGHEDKLLYGLHFFKESPGSYPRMFDFTGMTKGKRNMYETNRLILRKAVFSDWEQMYRNIWCHEETARYMLWAVTESEAAAKERMERTIAFQQSHHAWLVVEKESGKAIGFAGLREESGVCEDTGIAVGPRYVGKGYGTEILNELVRIAKEGLNAHGFIATCRNENEASRKMILGCGFRFSHTEPRIDKRNGEKYTLEFYRKEI